MVFRSHSKMKILAFLILCFASVALAEDFKAIDGKEYKNVRVNRVEPDGIVLISKSGISKVYLTELPKEVQDRFHYDAAQAAAYSTEQAASQVAFQTQQAELRRKVAEEKNRYWIGQGPAKNQQAKVEAPAAVVAGRGRQVEVISHGTEVDIAKHVARVNSSRQAWNRWQGPIRRLRCARSTSSTGRRRSLGNSTSTRFRRLTFTIALAALSAPLSAPTRQRLSVT